MARTKQTKNGTKTAIVVLVLLLAIGFAAVSTTLVINGTIRIGANATDFETNVIFKSANHTGATQVSGEAAGIATISADGKSITWTTQLLDNINETATLTYTIQNNSQYNATLGEVQCAFGTITNDADWASATKAATISNEYVQVVATNSQNGASIAKGTTTDTTNISGVDTVVVTQKKSYAGETNPGEYTFTCRLTATASETA